MNIMKTMVLSFIFALMLIGTVHAEDGAMKGIKLGFGFDRGFGVAGALGKFKGFIGNDGVSVDYIFNREAINNADIKVPVFWYVAAGGYGDWDGDLGVRLPVGVDVGCAKRFDGYAELIPRLRVNNDAKFGLDFGIGVRYQF
jgi:hypothetical protein